VQRVGRGGGKAGGAVNIPHKLFAAPFVSLLLSLFSAKKVPRHVRAVAKSLPSHLGKEYLKIVSVFASHVVKALKVLSSEMFIASLETDSKRVHGDIPRAVCTE